MKVSRAFVALLAASLMMALGAAPSAVAASGNDSASAKSAQNTPSARTINRRLNTVRRQVSSARRTLSRTSRDLGALTGRVRNAEGGLGLILGQAPAILAGLTAVRDQIAPGLSALATTVRDTIAPGLIGVRDAISSVEYGVAGVVIESGAATIAVGTSQVSSDIPDDGNPAVTRARTLIQTGAGTDPIKFSLRAFIRSNEGDNAPNLTVGQAGGFATVKRVDFTSPEGSPGGYNQAGVLQDCADDNPLTTGAANQFVLGTQPGATIVTAAGNKTDLRLVNIAGGNPRTNTSDPTTAHANLFPAGLPQCTIVPGGANELYEVDWTASFVDVPTSTSPGPRD